MARGNLALFSCRITPEPFIQVSVQSIMGAMEKCRSRDIFNFDDYVAVRKGRLKMADVKKATQSKVSQKADPDLLTQIDRKETEKADKLRNLSGTDDPIFAHGLWQQLEKASFTNGKFSEGTLRFLASIVAHRESYCAELSRSRARYQAARALFQLLLTNTRISNPPRTP